jgi:hypothetical protein
MKSAWKECAVLAVGDPLQPDGFLQADDVADAAIPQP